MSKYRKKDLSTVHILPGEGIRGGWRKGRQMMRGVKGRSVRVGKQKGKENKGKVE